MTDKEIILKGFKKAAARNRDNPENIKLLNAALAIFGGMWNSEGTLKQFKKMGVKYPYSE